MQAMNIKPEFHSWIDLYAKNVLDEFGKEFGEQKERFPDFKRPLRRFDAAVQEVQSKCDRNLISGVYEAHNELCIASRLIKWSEPRFTLIEYEPELAGTPKSIDYRATTADGYVLYVDVKTIRPKRPIQSTRDGQNAGRAKTERDYWCKFVELTNNESFPANVKLILSEELGGGTAWHDMFTARSRMLEYALEYEEKIRAAKLAQIKASFCFWLCSSGTWSADELEDFVAFYRTGRYRYDDSLAKMSADYCAKEGVTLDRTINHFACMTRREDDLRESSLVGANRLSLYDNQLVIQRR